MSRRRNRLTQKEAIFYQLMKNRNEGKNEYIPVFAFMGEHFVKELSKWGYVSYECSARLSEMHKANPGLIDRTKMTGKSGARYYGYRLHPNAKPEMIAEEELAKFYRVVKARMLPKQKAAAPVEVEQRVPSPIEMTEREVEHVGGGEKKEKAAPEPWWIKD